MDTQTQMNPQNLERYSFFWSEIRLLLGAIALFLGGLPPLIAFNPIPSLIGTLQSVLTIAWIISGVVSLYLLYMWNKKGKTIFGGKEQIDLVAFFIMVITGINLGITGLGGGNIGMRIVAGNRIIFFIAAVLYVWTAWYLNKRWIESGKKLF